MSRRSSCLLGLTGNIACGKSTVAQMLASLGAEIIDADLVAHEVMQPDGELLDHIVQRFGEAVRRSDGTLDRQALGAIVFADMEALADLERITHPPTVAEILHRVESSSAAAVVINAIKLFEAGLADHCDENWTVYCNPTEQLRRLMARNGLTRDEADTRISAQPPQDEKRRRADQVIDNSGDETDTLQQVRNAWYEFIQRCQDR